MVLRNLSVGQGRSSAPRNNPSRWGGSGSDCAGQSWSSCSQPPCLARAGNRRRARRKNYCAEVCRSPVSGGVWKHRGFGDWLHRRKVGRALEPTLSHNALVVWRPPCILESYPLFRERSHSWLCHIVRRTVSLSGHDSTSTNGRFWKWTLLLAGKMFAYGPKRTLDLIATRRPAAKC